jgi:hypothetical protein
MQIHNKVHKLICFYVLIIVDLATMGCGSSPPRADATPRIDATTEASFLKSLAEMKSSMPKPEANQLDNTVLTYISMVQWKYSPKYLERARASGVDRAGLEPTELHALLLEIYRSLHGFTASEIKLKTVAAAQETQKHNEEMSAKFEADAAKRPPIVPPKNEGVEQVWTVKGPYETVATDPGGQALFALQKQGRCDVLDPSGKITRTFDLVGFKLSRQSFARVKLCFARLAKGEESLITMSSSSNAQDEILFSRSDGTKIWSNYDSPDLFRDFGDFLVADLDGDGIDELIGNGSSGGTRVTSAKHKLLWEHREANGRRVATGDFDGNGTPIVVSMSAPQGRLHFYGAKDGAPLRTIEPGVYPGEIRTAPGKAFGVPKGDVLVLSGSGGNAPLIVLGGDGKKLRSLYLSDHFDDTQTLAVSSDGNWAAVFLRLGRLIRIVDLGHGTVVGQVVSESAKHDFTWVARGKAATPLLVIASGSDLTAFQLKPIESSSSAK